MDVITAPVFGASDKPIRMLAIWRDVTEARKARDEAEAARHEAERLAERLSAVLESTMDSVLVVDRSWRISYFNIKAMRLLQPASQARNENRTSSRPREGRAGAVLSAADKPRN
ncbi:PAS domain-containing protein [Sinorhizobium meliloti]|uniref:PAS domain-containing protein n=1 Tax=Rhizobium meliloti TaxID=382 RepID=UPI001F15938B|nr:PAS domain-containing protein [Sinorhizobium meliloti]WQO37487.1 PAS domain-containing protein [Sinorhizobium meliloti]WQO77959.1 PAS domain-containing protein [Sinorhizobium meliloti]